MTTVSPLGLELLRSRPCGSSADAYSGGFRTLVRGDCVGDQGRDQVKPLCDKKLVTVEDQQNPAADFFFFTQNGLQIPGRVIGLMADNLHFGRRGLRLRFRRVRRLGGGRGRS